MTACVAVALNPGCDTAAVCVTMEWMTMIEVAGMRYKADITAGALKLPESRIIADLLLRKVDDAGLEGRHCEQERPPGPQPCHGNAVLTKLDPWTAGDYGAGLVEAGPRRQR